MGGIPKPYDIYLFDLDGTLTDTGPVWLGIFRDCLADAGVKNVDDKTIAAHTHNWSEVLKLGVTEAALPAFIEAAYARANERLSKAPFYQGVENMLVRLKQNGKGMAVITSMDRPILEPVIAHRKLHDYFEVIIAGTDVEHYKPHPAGIHEALKKLGAGKNQSAVYLGDKDTDILAGQNAGIDTILFYPPAHELMYDKHALMACKPTRVISSWHQLAA